MQLLFNFLLSDYLFAALATGDAETLVESAETIPLPPRNGQWANFLRNLDELNLEWLSESQRRAVFDRFAPDEEMRIFGRGIRRRLAPMLDGRRHLELAFSLLLSMPGTPVVPYGDEIGMGEDLSLDGRSAVRTPMQWSDDRNGGFSSAPEDELARPVVEGGEYGYQAVNVDDQRNDPGSLLQWFARAVGVRREHPAFGRGQVHFLRTNGSVLAHRVTGRRDVVAVHNLADESGTVTLEVEEDLVPIFGDQRSEVVPGDPLELDMDGYGYRWFRVGVSRV